ncbi:MAG: hypothetical protein ACYS5V_04425, partial [Planctomycetota bacterium]
YTEIAHLLTQAGDREAAARAARLAKGASDEEAREGLGMFEVMGGNKALAGVLIEAGKLDEALKVATGSDGRVDPGVLPALVEAYASRGNSKMVQRLMPQTGSPEVKYQLCLAAARGACERAEAAKKEKDNPTPKP